MAAMVLIASTVFAFESDTSGAGAVDQVWAARFDGPAGGSDQARDIAVDAQGNVYVTGGAGGLGTDKDFVTVKYGPGGDELWAATYDGASGDDDAIALAVGAGGTVYVAGSSDGDGNDADYATVAYDADGGQLWAARYNGPAGQADNAAGLAIDAAGNVYVTGRSRGPGTSWDYATVKYAPDGSVAWVKRYDGPVSGPDAASALAVDSDGNVYVTGFSLGDGTGINYLTVKYDADGGELWAARYDGPGSGADHTTDIAVDATGNVYVTGFSAGPDEHDDYATVKYASDGSEVWVARYDGPGGGRDWPAALAVGSDGGVYVTGFSESAAGNGDYTTIRYGADGSERWVARYDGPEGAEDHALDLALDAAGNVTVTGGSNGSSTITGSGNTWDYATVLYDANGNERWVARYAGPAGGTDVALGVAADGEGGVYVTGYSHGAAGDRDYLTLRYAPAAKSQRGDANCDGAVNSIDAALVLQAVAFATLLPCEDGADASADGAITSIDAALILQLTAGLLDSLDP